MPEKKPIFHPYIPNSLPEIQTEMLKEIGVNDIDELYADIPEELRLKGEMNLPESLTSECELKRHVDQILAKNTTCQENLNFLGAGCWQHYVPAICDEINHRAEFLTAYAGEPYEDHGRFQALFEYASMMGELLDMDVVNVPTYDWAQAASTSIRMAARITGRDEALVSEDVSPERLAVIKNYCRGTVAITMVERCPNTGLVDPDDLRANMSSNIAGFYFENPTYLGKIEHQGQLISDTAHEYGALSLVGVDPISLGVLTPPIDYGADIVSGDVQPLGVRMQYGGGKAGFIATRDEEKFVAEYPSRLFGIARTSVEGEYGFGDVLYERTSFAHREHAKEFVGTASALWGITAGVYLALVGPQGMQELGQTIMQKSQYAMKKLSEIPGISILFPGTPNFKEFVVDFNKTGKTVKAINTALLEQGIFGGHDLSASFPEFGQSALYCVTEVHTKKDLDTLVQALYQIIQ